MTLPVLTKKSKHKIKELKNVEEHIFHPGGNSNHYCSMMMNMPISYANYPLSQTSDRTKNRLAVFAVKLRESFKAYLSDKDEKAISATTHFGLHMHPFSEEVLCDRFSAFLLCCTPQEACSSIQTQEDV